MRMLLCLASLLAVPVFAATLNQGERDRAMSELHASRKQVLDAVAGLTPAQWNFKPSPSAWSIAEIVEHVAVTEDWLFDIVTKKIMAAPAQPEKQAETKGKDEMVLKTIADRRSKREAPETIAPKRRWTPQAAVDHFRASRDRTIDYIRTTPDDLRAHVEPHRAVGLIDAYQWILVAASHATRHVAQIDEVKASPRYPR